MSSLFYRSSRCTASGASNTRSSGTNNSSIRRPFSGFPAAALTIALLLFFLLGAAQPSDARLERQAYVSYRTPHLCSYEMMTAVGCDGDTPMCCVASSAIRCCAATTSCGNCTDTVVGYEMPKSSVILGCFSLSVLVLLGSIIMSGIGRHLAWVLERRRVIENYRKRLALRRAEAREFKKELAETEEKDIEDTVACVICCARHIDVALTPCGHVCCCRFCAKRLRECPVCRAAVQRCFDLPLYYVTQLVKAAAEEREGGEEAGGNEQSPLVSSTPSAPTAATSATTTVPTISSSSSGVRHAHHHPHHHHDDDDVGDFDTSVEEDELEAVEEGALTREDQEALVTRRGSASATTISNAATAAPSSSSAASVGASAAARFNPFRRKRYTRLLADDEDSGEGGDADLGCHAGHRGAYGGAALSAGPEAAVSEAATHSATRRDAGGVGDVAAAPSAHKDGFISVEK